MARCSNCGSKFPEPVPRLCPGCNTDTRSALVENIIERRSMLAEEFGQGRQAIERSDSGEIASVFAKPSPLQRLAPLQAPQLVRSASWSATPAMPNSSRRVKGRIIAAEQSGAEPPDFNLCMMLNRGIWLLLIIAAPFLLVGALFLRVGPFTGFTAAVGCLFLLRYLTPSNILAVLHLSFLLHPFDRSRDPAVPVRFLRVRDQEVGAEHMVRIKGWTHGGNLSSDDLVTFDGKWKSGVLHARRSYNHRTRSMTTVRESLSWLALCASLGVIATLIILLKEPVGWLIRETANLLAR
jgi:hypothetical protein